MPRCDVDVRAVAWAAFAIAATIVVVVCSVFALLHFWRVAPGADRLRLPYALVIEGAGLESAPQPELRAAREAKAHLLTTSGWIDGAHGIAHIPITTAMRVLVAQGSTAAVTAAASAATPVSAASAAVPTSSPALGPTSETGSTR